MNYPDIMIDLETSGTRPDRTSIIQIAAVKFNYTEGAVDPNMFDRCLHMMPHRSWQEDTRQFWMKNQTVLRGLLGRAENPVTVLDAFAQWVGYNQETPPVIWAKPSHFEFPFLESHFHDAGIPSPFHYRNVVDLRSWMRGAGHPTADGDVPFQGDVHNALHDALHQLRIVLHVRSLING